MLDLVPQALGCTLQETPLGLMTLLFRAGTQLPQEQSKVFFPLVWSTASPGTGDVLFVPDIVTSLRPSLSSGNWSDHKTVK